MAFTNNNYKLEIARQDLPGGGVDRYVWNKKDAKVTFSSDTTLTRDDLFRLFDSTLEIDTTSGNVLITLPELEESEDGERFKTSVVGSNVASVKVDAANTTGSPPVGGGTLVVEDGDVLVYDHSATRLLPATDVGSSAFTVFAMLIGWADIATWDPIAKTLVGPIPTEVQGDGLDFATYYPVGYFQTVSVMDATIKDARGAFEVLAYGGGLLVLRRLSNFDRSFSVSLTNGALYGGTTFLIDYKIQAFTPTSKPIWEKEFHRYSPRLLAADYLCDVDLGGAHAANGVFNAYYLNGTGALPDIDEQTPVIGERVLLTKQTDKTQNAYWHVTILTPNWQLQRISWHAQSKEIVKNTLVAIEKGGKYSDTLWRMEAAVDNVDPGVDEVTFEQVSSKRKTLLDLDFVNLASQDIKAGGDGVYVLDGTSFNATNAPASQQFEIVNGTGLQVQADVGQELDPPNNSNSAPQLRIALTSLLNGFGISETEGLCIWSRLGVANLSSVTESCGLGLVASGANPAHFVSLKKKSDGIYADRHAPSNLGAAGLVDGNTSPDILVIEKVTGTNLWTLRTGAWTSGWPDISATTIIGFFYLKSPGNGLINAGDLLKYSDIELTLFNSNSVVSVPASYAHAQGSGDRTATITITSDMPTNGTFPPWINGDTASDGQFSFTGGATPAVGRYFAFDFGAPRLITEAKRYQGGTTNSGVWQWQGSSDGSSWVNEGSTFTWGGSPTGAVMGDLSAANTLYRHWQIVGISGNIVDSEWQREIEFKIGESAAPVATDYDLIATFKNLKVEVF